MSSIEEVSFQLSNGVDPRSLLCGLLQTTPDEFSDVPDEKLVELLHYVLQESSRPMIQHQGVYADDIAVVVDLVRQARNIVFVIGAGASVGPDFRSPGGLYDMIGREGVLEDPYDVFDRRCFAEDPSIFWRFAHTIFPAVEPTYSFAQCFIERVYQEGKLLRLYSQNVDTLEKGIPEDKLNCVHGSWRHNHCLNCSADFSIEELRPFVEAQSVPLCPHCGGIIKPGIVFFGEPTDLDDGQLSYDSQEADLLIVVGTSLQVAPVSYIPRLFRHIPSILINREPVTCEFNAELLGSCDEVLSYIEGELGWGLSASSSTPNYYPPNKFVFSDNCMHFYETSQLMFAVTPV